MVEISLLIFYEKRQPLTVTTLPEETDHSIVYHHLSQQISYIKAAQSSQRCKYMQWVSPESVYIQVESNHYDRSTVTNKKSYESTMFCILRWV